MSQTTHLATNSIYIRDNIEDGAIRAPDAPSVPSGQDSIMVGLIDGMQFSRDCLIQALRIHSPALSMVPFKTVSECIDAAPAGLRMILYYSHQESSLQTAVLQRVHELRQAFPGK